MIHRVRDLVAAAALVAAGVSAQEPATKDVPGGQQVMTVQPNQTITLQVGRSTVIRAPWRVTRVSITSPEIADVQALTPDTILLQGKTLGSTDVTLWSETEESLQAWVYVDDDLVRLKTELTRLFPLANLELSRSGEVVIVQGLLARAEHAEHLRKFLEASGLRYVDMTSLAGVQQVQIQVRLAEVSRTAIRALGVNFFQTGPHFFGGQTVGSASGGGGQRFNIGVPEGADATSSALPFLFNNATSVSPLTTLFLGFPDANLQFFLQALAENQYLRILAEPNLVALSGEEASFLAGGEFPIPVVQGSGAASTSITIEYREFGVRLQFLPLVLGDGTIRLRVAPEVSDLTDIGAVEIQGFRVPSLVTRRAETTLELRSGQTFAMAGLLSQSDDARNSRIPVLGDLPILGPLFRSTRYESGETELVVLVTASLVDPLNKPAEAIALPGATHEVPNDWEFFVRGTLEGEPAAKGLPPMKVISELGLDRLRGPGSWVSYDHEPRRSTAPIQPVRPAADAPPQAPSPSPSEGNPSSSRQGT